ncbi:hypothetical protein [Mesorhizobium sp.]|uniref:hypothetical protein n=1 Tax=Mesorhizobium sp. TaxID=1871066 RepID=UPI0025C36D60|nr:hypothetical protein [Mesorhizobium sp.]
MLTLFVYVVAALSGCGTVKEKTAPCKRPANLTSYAPDPRLECGPMMHVNGDASPAFAAIEAMEVE